MVVVVHKLGWIMVACNQMSLINIIIILQLSHSLFIIYHNLIITWARDGHNNHKNIISVTHIALAQPPVFSPKIQILFTHEMHVNDERRIGF